MTGAKYGCGEGQCRACTVLLGGKSRRLLHDVVGDADKQTILTVEGLPRGKTSPGATSVSRRRRFSMRLLHVGHDYGHGGIVE